MEYQRYIIDRSAYTRSKQNEWGATLVNLYFALS